MGEFSIPQGVHDDECVTGLLDVDEAVDAAKHWLRETLAEEATR
jgi:hypothetical protein